MKEKFSKKNKEIFSVLKSQFSQPRKNISLLLRHEKTLLSVLLFGFCSSSLLAQDTTISFQNFGAGLTSADNTLTVSGAGSASVSGVVDGDGFLYSITMDDYDFDGDSIHDSLSFNLRVSGRRNGTVTTSSAAIGTDSEQVVILTNADVGSPFMWIPAGNDSSRFSAGESLVFEVENILVNGATTGFARNFLGFTDAFLTERGGNNHSATIGSGENLPNYKFPFSANASINNTDILYISSTSSATSNEGNWGVNNVDFSIRIYPLREAQVFYVSPDGGDANSGSFAEPFASVSHALDQVLPGETIFLRAGTYRDVIDLSDVSGDVDAPITIQPYQNEEVILSGLKEISPTWTIEEGSVYKALVPEEVTQLFVDGELMTLARFPNASPFSSGAFRGGGSANHDSGSTSTTTVSSQLADFGSSLDGCIAVQILDSHVSHADIISGHSGGGSSFTYPLPDRIGVKHGFFLEGGVGASARQLIDSSNEWAYDEIKGELFLWAPEGGSLAGRNIEIKNKVYSLIANENTAHIIIDGFQFKASTFYLEGSDNVTIRNCDFEYYACSRRAVGETVRPLTAQIDGSLTDRCENITIYNCKFERADGSGLWADYCESLTVENNLFYLIDYASVSPQRNTGTENFTETQGTVVLLANSHLIYRRNTMHTSNSGQGLIAAVEQPLNGKPSIIEYNYHTNLATRENDGAAFQIPLEHAIACLARNNWSLDNWQRDWRWDGNNRPLRGIHSEFIRNVAMSNRNKTIASVEGFHLKGDYHENYNNTSIYDDSEMGVAVNSGGNSNTKTMNNAVDRFSDLPIPGIHSHNFSGSEQPSNMSVMLRDPDNHDFRPRAGSPADLYLIDKGIPVIASRDYVEMYNSPGTTTNIETIDVTAGFVGDAPDIGAYEYGDTYYWLPGRQDQKAAMPVPREDGEYVAQDADLMYLIGLDGVSANIYFGESPNELRAIEINKPASQNIVNLPNFKALAPDFTYYWRVDTVLSDGSIIEGDVWSFTTRVERGVLIPMTSRTVDKGATWNQSTSGAAFSTSSTSFQTRAILYSDNAYDVSLGFELTVGYNTDTSQDVAHSLSFGLISADSISPAIYSGFNPFRDENGLYGIGVNVVEFPQQGLVFADGNSVNVLDSYSFPSEDKFEYYDSYVVKIKMESDGSWSYSVKGKTIASGNLPEFDLSQDYYIVIYGQDDDGGAKTIQHVSIDTFSLAQDPYDIWAAGQGLSGADIDRNADVDSDGIKNLLEFVLNGDPNADDRAYILPKFSTSNPFDKTYTYKRRKDSIDVTSQRFELSDDLESWFNVDVTDLISAISITGDSNDPESEQVSIDLTPYALSGKLFIRMRVDEK